jgi:hypothetical protein
MNQQNTANARIVYENAAKICAKYGVNLDTAKATQSDLILEQQLFANTTNYQFPVRQDDNGPSGTKFNTEVRLTNQDSFIASAWGFFLLKPASAIDTTFIAQTYPNPQVFTSANTSAAAETLYNSYCRITVNNDVVLPIWHMSRHRMVPQTQQEPLIVGVQNAIPYSQIDLSQDGFVPVEPNLIFIGTKGYIINLVLPAALAAVETFERARIHYRGLLLQNSTLFT